MSVAVAEEVEDKKQVIESPDRELTAEEQLKRFQDDIGVSVRKLTQQYGTLTVDVEDKELIAQVTAGHKEVKGLMSRVEKTRKTLKADALEWGRTVDRTAADLKKALQPIADHLKGERDKIDAEKQRKKNEAKQKAAEELQRRVDQLREVNGSVSNLVELESMPEAAFEIKLRAATEAFEHAKLQTEAREFQAQLRELGAEVEFESILNASREDRAELLATAKSEAEAVRVEKEQAEQRRQEALTLQATLASYGISKSFDEVAAMSADEAAEMMASAKQAFEDAAAERKRQEEVAQAEREQQAERFRQQQEELRILRAEKVAREREAEEVAAAERAEALRPQFEKLTAFAGSLKRNTPEGLDEELGDSLNAILDDAADAIRELANTLQ